MATKNAGFSLIELCVILIIVLVLIGMLLPALCADREGARKTICGNNQRQIIIACNVYPADQDGVWPIFTANGSGHWIAATDPTFDPVATAIASLELTATFTGNELSLKVFTCPSKPHARPSKNATLVSRKESMSGWASEGSEHFGYAYDWSVPSNATSDRVVTADRDRTAHRGHSIMAGFADGRVSPLTRQRSRGTTSVTFLNRYADQDDIYSDLNDGPMDIPGEGSTTRAFVR